MEKKYRIILHIDMNAFFASCEIAQDKSLKDIPIGIGGNSERGVITTANYVARKFGVKSAMSVVEAKRLCPNLKMLPVNFELYNQYSENFFSLLSEYTSNIEKASIDEGYLDITELSDDVNPLEIVKEIQDRLVKEHDLPCSVGVAPNMFLAKMASDMKKPLGITILRKRDVKEKLWPLPIEEMHGIGKKTYPNLKLIGITTIGDLVNYENRSKLKLVLGNRYQEFIDKANGIDNRIVDPFRQAINESIGNSNTYNTDLTDYQEILQNLYKLTKNVVNRLNKAEKMAKTISIQVKYNNFTQITRSKTILQHTDSFLEFYQLVEDLYDENQGDLPIRLLGVSLSNIKAYEKSAIQLNIFDAPKGETKDEKVIRLLSQINDSYGADLISRGIKKSSGSKYQ